MSKKQPSNIAASIRQRLLNKARTEKRTFNELLQYFAMDRLLSRQFDFKSLELQKAIHLTLQNRKTDLPEKVTAFTDDFIQTKSTQWKAFRRKITPDTIPVDFEEVISQVEQFLTPAIQGILSNTKISLTWKAPGTWEAS